MIVRRLLTPRWLAFTVLVGLAAVACGWLGWWQWQRFHAVGGTFQNLGYTIQWPFFAAFAVYVWWRLLRDAGRPVEEPDEPAQKRAEPEPIREPVRGPARQPLDQPVDGDDELAAYNRYLAELHQRSGSRRD